MNKLAVYLVCFMISTTTLVLEFNAVEAENASTYDISSQEPELHMDRRLAREVQTALKDQGFYDGPIDGLIGPQTREALRNFQRAHRLPVSGRLDEATVKQLGISLEKEGKEKGSKGVFGKIGAGVKTAGGAVAEGAVVGAQATAKGATTAGKATAEGSTVAAKKTGQGSTTAAKATAKGATATGKAVKGVFTSQRSDAEILYEIQDQFKQDPQIDPTHIDIGVSDGIVTLTQREGTRSELERAVAIAKKIGGVKQVVRQAP